MPVAIQASLVSIHTFIIFYSVILHLGNACLLVARAWPGPRECKNEECIRADSLEGDKKE